MTPPTPIPTIFFIVLAIVLVWVVLIWTFMLVATIFNIFKATKNRGENVTPADIAATSVSVAETSTQKMNQYWTEDGILVQF